MNKTVVYGLVIISLILTISPALAKSKIGSLENPVDISLISMDIGVSPFELTFRGYQGRYHAQGIGGFSSFQENIRRGKIKSKNLVEAAIAVGDLSIETMNDEAYLNAVDMQLQGFARR